MPSKPRPPRPPRPQGPRVNLTLTPELNALLGRFQAATGVGKATFIRQMLDEGMPQLRMVVEAAEKATRGNIRALDLMADAIRQSRDDIDQAELDLKDLGPKSRRLPVRKLKPV